MKVGGLGIEWCSAHHGVIDEGEIDCDRSLDRDEDTDCVRHALFYEKDEPKIGPNPFLIIGDTAWQLWDDMARHHFMMDLSDSDRTLLIEYILEPHPQRRNEK